MEYVLSIPEVLGDICTLDTVASAMARRAASAGDRGFHEPAFKNLLPRYISDLVAEVRVGNLKICNQRGMLGTIDSIIDESRRERPILELVGDANRTISLNVFVSVYQLNVWAKERGDLFHINNDGVPWIDERGWNNVVGSPPEIEFDFEPCPDAPLERKNATPALVVTGQAGGVVAASDGPAPLTTAQTPDVKSTVVLTNTETTAPLGDQPRAAHGDAASDAPVPAPVKQQETMWVDKGAIYKKKALVEHLLAKWPDIVTDFQHGKANGLIAAARVPGQHGEYFENSAIKWAKKKGKWIEREPLSMGRNLMENVPSRKYISD